MKNLRKVLAVVLVVALAFSMMAVASAKQVTDYTDNSTIKYTEAVDLVTGLGIMTGSGDTTFAPTSTFTREQAAKVITYVLIGATVANTLTTTASSFSDVAASRWSAPYIQYCANAGIINGDGSGMFNPEAAITGTQFAKLLLTALGYGAKGEFVGANWELNTLIKAQALGILSTGVNYSAAATRQEVAKYAFNALTTCYPQTYNSVLGSYQNAITDTSVTTSGIYAKQTLGYSTFQLLKTNVTNTYYGALSHYWKAYTTTTPTTVSGNYSDDTVLYTSSIGYPFNLSNVTTASSGWYKVGLETDPANVSYFYNGAVSTLGAISGLSNSIGVVVKYIDNTTPGVAGTASNGLADTVYVTDYTVTTLNSAPTVDVAGNVSISAGGLLSSYAKGALVYPAGLVANQYVNYVVWNSGTDTNTYIQNSTKVTGQITTANSSGSFVTVAGKGYYVDAGATVPVGGLSNSAFQNVATTAWISADGYVIFCKPDVTASYNVGLVVGYLYDPAASVTGAAAQVLLYTNDGKLASYTVAADSTGIVPNQSTSGTGHTSAFYTSPNTTATLVSYSFNGSGQVTVWPVTAAYASSGTYGYTGTVTAVNSTGYSAGSSLVTVNGNGYYINSATKVYYFDGTNPYSTVSTPANTGTVLTGYANTIYAPVNTNVTIVTDPNSGSLLDAIYFNLPAPAGTSGNYAYQTLASYTLRSVNGVNYYDYSCYVNGATKPTILTSVGAPVTAWVATVPHTFVMGLFSYTIDANGYVTGATRANAPTAPATWQVTYADSSFVGFTNTQTNANMSFAVDSNTKYFQSYPNTWGLSAAQSTMPISATGAVVRITDYVLSTASGAPALYVYYQISAT
jgi:hypothetical protein